MSGPGLVCLLGSACCSLLSAATAGVFGCGRCGCVVSAEFFRVWSFLPAGVAERLAAGVTVAADLAVVAGGVAGWGSGFGVRF